jgi:hypothetical protein
MRVRPVVVAISTALAGLVLMPGLAAASCAPGVSVAAAVAAAGYVFVGTVTGVDNGGRVATVQVDDVWKGASVGAVVHVTGTPDLGAAATSVDRTYESGRQYLFVPSGGSRSDFQDNQCTETQAYSSSLASLRPASAPGAPVSSGAGGASLVVVFVAAGLAIVAAFALAALTYRRRQRRASDRIS